MSVIAQKIAGAILWMAIYYAFYMTICNVLLDRGIAWREGALTAFFVYLGFMAAKCGSRWLAERRSNMRARK